MPSPTDQQILDAFRGALLALATAQAYEMPNGRSVTRADLAEIHSTIAIYEQRVAAARNPGDASLATGIVLVSN